MDYLDYLESESIHILRETAAQFRNSAILFSGGKDSTVVVRLAEKAFRPARFPMALLHIDTGHNFPETLDFRDQLVKDLGERLIVRRVQDSIDKGRAKESKAPNSSRNSLQSITLLDAISELGLEAVVGGARRDEEKARAKERIFSHRDEFGQWEPKAQRPELWSVYNGRIQPGEHMRIFPLSNWTELDVWRYIERERIPLPSIYFSHKRDCIRKKNGMILAAIPPVKAEDGERVETLTVRCRTVGDVTCTGLIESHAPDLKTVINEVIASRTTERGTRADDKLSETAMEDRKRQGYF
jgi:sulfate adenylyltransferase subunit 2